MQIRIKELRKSHKMNQAELAELIGVSTSAIGMYEQCRREPDMTTMLKIARCFNVSIGYLMGESEIPDSFDVASIAKGVAKNLMDQPALMFNAECYTDEELADLSLLIENSVKEALIERLSKLPPN